MSHFTVAVFTNKSQSYKDLLEPYCEGLEVEPYIYETKQEVLNKIEEFCQKDDELKCEYANLSDLEKITDWTGLEMFDEDGNPLTTYNPNSKWDWYEVGGRWSYILKRKDGHFVNECLVSELDLTPDQEAYNNAIRFWEIIIEGQPLKYGEEMPFTIYRKEYYLDRYKNKETYAKVCSNVTTFAVITPDGKWYEKGEMGWFGCSSETHDESLDWDLHYQERFIDNVDQNLTITIVDCHI